MTRGSWYKKGLVVGIILLFIGVGIQPVLADSPIITSKEINEDCIECQVSEGYSHLKLNLLLTRIKTINNIISLISGEDEGLSVDFSPDGRIICDYLYSLAEKFEALQFYYNDLYHYYIDNGYLALGLIFMSLSTACVMSEYWVNLLYKALLC